MSTINWKEIRQEWETTKITLTKLADKHDVKLGTLKSRKSREAWSRNPTKKDATFQRDATPKNKKDATKNKRKEQKNRSGNPNPDNRFTERNSAALKHGLFSRYIPKETLEIMGMMDKGNPADLIWDQIMIQYAAIIRAQQIMFTDSRDDTTKELRKLKVENAFDREGNEIQVPVEQEYEIQFAWDKHATFMNAQSRAIGELRSSIKQFLEMAHDSDERRLKLEKMQIGIEKTKVEITRMSGDTLDEYEDDGFIEALGDAVEVWNDDSDGSTEEA